MFRGEIDLATADILREGLAKHDHSPVLDFQGVTFIDSTGLAALLQHQQDHGCSLEIVPSEFVARVIELMGVQERVRLLEA